MPIRQRWWFQREEHGEQGGPACDCGSTGMTGATKRSPGVVGDGYYSGEIARTSAKTAWWKPSRRANDANWRPKTGIQLEEELVNRRGLVERKRQ